MRSTTSILFLTVLLPEQGVTDLLLFLVTVEGVFTDGVRRGVKEESSNSFLSDGVPGSSFVDLRRRDKAAGGGAHV